MGPSSLTQCRLLIFFLLFSYLESMRVVVFGANGRTGNRLVKLLVKNNAVSKVICPVRDLGTARTRLGKESARLSLLPCDIVQADKYKLSQILDEADSVCVCSGYSPGRGQLPDPLGSFKVDNCGNKRIIDACVETPSVKKVVFLSSVLANGLKAGQVTNPQYILLNSFGGILLNKRAAEMHLQQSDLDWTIIRPGGLTGDNGDDEESRNQSPLLFGNADTIFGGSISRDRVAEVMMEACFSDASSKKIVEIVQSRNARAVTIEQGFDQIQ
jgi:nucleoside-diphosphate-sugar epimerase